MMNWRCKSDREPPNYEIEIEERKKTEESLREALARIKTLSGLLPICASCKKIRDDQGNWEHVEVVHKKQFRCGIYAWRMPRMRIQTVSGRNF